jgi:hypothetical protein
MMAPQVTSELQRLLELRHRANRAYQHSMSNDLDPAALLDELNYLTAKIDSLYFGGSR